MPTKFQDADGNTYYTRIGWVIDGWGGIIKDHFSQGNLYDVFDGVVATILSSIALPICYAGTFGKTGLKKIEVME
jgi:hypothetical protein